MNRETEEFVSKISRIVNLTSSELEDISRNPLPYMRSSEIMELLEADSEYRSIRIEVSRLDTALAKRNYENYEAFEAARNNAIILGGLRAKLRLMKKDVPENLTAEVDRLISRYLMAGRS